MNLTISVSGGVAHVPYTKESAAILKKALSYKHLGNSYLNRKFGRHLYATDFSCYDEVSNSFPAGLVKRATAALEAASYMVLLVGPALPTSSRRDESLREYQNDATDKLLSSWCGHVSVPTGGGKTHIIASLVMRLGVSLGDSKQVIVVPSSEILGQVYTLMCTKLGKRNVSRVGGGMPDVLTDGKLLIGTYQTLTSRIDGNDEFVCRFLYTCRAMIVDECHHCPCDSIQKVVRACHDLLYHYGLSATPWRGDGLDFVMEGLVGPLVHEVQPQFLASSGFITPGTVFMANVDKTSKMGDKKGDYSAIYKEFLLDCVHRRELEIAACRQALVMGLTAMCFTKHVRHAQDLCDALTMLDATLPIALLTGELVKKERTRILTGLSDGTYKLVISTIGKEGLDIPGIDAVILAGGGSDPSQEVGRALRSKKDKLMAYVWDFYDAQHAALLRASKARLKWYEEAGIFKVVRV